MNLDIIIGLHSIVAAINNSDRRDKVLYCTDESQSELKKKYGKINLDKVEVKVFSSHKVQEEAQNILSETNFKVDRVPSGAFLTCSKLKITEVTSLYDSLGAGACKILCLDQVSDVHNAAAIMRTASFYGVTHVVFSQKGSFGFSPSFYRIASGATEFIKVVQTPNLSRLITKLLEKDVKCVGLSEHATVNLESIQKNIGSLCLVLGSEENGLSNAVKRVVEELLSLESQGDIKSLNVSVAAAVAMEKCFSQK
jgi:23S rRNA (guanosine2251-2'-O)-methyltransferase